MPPNPVRASARSSISWDSGPAFEDTSTLVLTIHSYSLDLRVFEIPDSVKGSVDWATVARVQEQPDSTAEKPILKWSHIIDSRPPPKAEALPDVGTFTILDETHVAEEGIMYNPKTGANQSYVEVWERFPGAVDQDFVVLETLDGTGFLGRVGARALGLRRSYQGHLTAWRAEKPREDDTRWNILFHQVEGGLDLPLLPAESPIALGWKLGDSISLGGLEFIVKVVGGSGEPSLSLSK
ncbi:hypothetical protein IE53DRAFT_363614 [Violaceomyces palustris]|uniref:Uncharacterized protein n=1 Tax=Violaceomyces palustris TaxID=1673888 RepID=A0ACD0NSU9_9BASI|nr:hypothetical protein IE53DRAFT_363614 [Violaceomyces palustris]